MGSSEVQIEPQDVLLNLVSEYELHSAAVFSHTSWIDWLRLSVEDRAMIVAHYRIEKAIELFYALKHKKELEALNHSIR